MCIVKASGFDLAPMFFVGLICVVQALLAFVMFGSVSLSVLHVMIVMCVD